jgi:hypothetical protein
MVTEPSDYTGLESEPRPLPALRATFPTSGEVTCLPGAAAAGSEALDLAGFRRGDVVRTPSHLAHEPLLLHLAPELAQRLLELLGILDDYPHNPKRIQGER